MGQESETEARARIFAPYQVNANLMSQAAPDAVFLHCLPAHRGSEVTDEVMESQWVEAGTLISAVEATPWAFSPWLTLQLPQLYAGEAESDQL